ncbi:MAG: hypothetical protein KDJ47_01800 [Hyphomicrobiaceae bacterium]|nr:hypothetical protein [Hyphomicrobiaceae bacterium]
MSLRLFAATALIAAVANLAELPHAHAGRFLHRDYGYNGIEEGHVVAQSRFGNGSVSGPVRMTRVGPQVRLPGGTWEYCRRSCSETLRVETVDRWEGPLNGNGLTQECGIFGCLSIGLGR